MNIKKRNGRFATTISPKVQLFDNYVTSMIITSLLLQAHPQHRSD